MGRALSSSFTFKNGDPMTAPVIPAIPEVLAEVNQIRAARGLLALDAMPKGTSACDDCPIAWALDADYVEPGADGALGIYSFRGSMLVHDLPPLLNAFAVAFDHREYPELDRA